MSVITRLIRWLKSKRKKRQIFQQCSEISIEKPIEKSTFRKSIKISKKACYQDISKFMKHGRQASWYRRSVKAKVKPKIEEEE